MTFELPTEYEQKTVVIDDLLISDAVMVRTSLNMNHVNTLADSIDDLPAIQVVQLPDDSMVLVDGHHRIEAHKKHEQTIIKAHVYQGTLLDAKAMAWGANATHGLPRKHREIELAVVRALSDDMVSQLSLREIANICGVSHMTVSNYKKQAEHKKEQKRLAEQREQAYLDSLSRAPLSDKPMSEIDPYHWIDGLIEENKIKYSSGVVVKRTIRNSDYPEQINKVCEALIVTSIRKIKLLNKGLVNNREWAQDVCLNGVFYDGDGEAVHFGESALSDIETAIASRHNTHVVIGSDSRRQRIDEPTYEPTADADAQENPYPKTFDFGGDDEHVIATLGEHKIIRANMDLMTRWVDLVGQDVALVYGAMTSKKVGKVSLTPLTRVSDVIALAVETPADLPNLLGYHPYPLQDILGFYIPQGTGEYNGLGGIEALALTYLFAPNKDAINCGKRNAYLSKLGDNGHWREIMISWLLDTLTDRGDTVLNVWGDDTFARIAVRSGRNVVSVTGNAKTAKAIYKAIYANI